MSKAKELCALLLTRGLKTLSSDEEDTVVDYLSDMGIDVDIDARPQDICITLMSKLLADEMEEDRAVPLAAVRAYSSRVLEELEEEKQEKAIQQQKLRQQQEERERLMRLQKERKATESTLRQNISDLPGCYQDDEIFTQRSYTLEVNDNVGLDQLPDGSYQNTAKIRLPANLFDRVFTATDNPIIEIIANGKQAYARLEGVSNNNNILVSPLIRKC